MFSNIRHFNVITFTVWVSFTELESTQKEINDRILQHAYSESHVYCRKNAIDKKGQI